MTRILFLDQTGQLGGAELMLADIAATYRDRGRVVLFEDGPFKGRLEAAGIPVSIAPLAASARAVKKDATLADALRAIPAMASVVGHVRRLAREADVIYANTAKALLVGVAAGWLAQRPVIFHLHDIVDTAHFSALNRRLLVWASRLGAKAVIANSVATKQAYVRAGGRESATTVIYNGIATARPAASQADRVRTELGLGHAPVVVMAGRLTHWKGQHVLLAALRGLPGWHAVIVGEALFTEVDRAYADSLRKSAEEPALAGRVHFAGFQAD
ncbi:MAG: glycosyltransferase family 1 protein, partial [Rhodocyclaceae bacterium]|nr:glycosyltransferase family 1 protein [Rhodocyclaceae bacterium]